MNSDRIKLVVAKIEILKLKADSYNWSCHVPKGVREELESTLASINKELEVGGLNE